MLYVAALVLISECTDIVRSMLHLVIPKIIIATLASTYGAWANKNAANNY